MITAAHMLFYTDDEAATRAFLRDVLELPNVDVHDGWLIFKTGPSELGVHPTAGPGQTHHEITFLCDDLASTIVGLEAKGAEFRGEVEQQRWGSTIMLKVPGAGDVMLYEARHPTAFDL